MGGDGGGYSGIQREDPTPYFCAVILPEVQSPAPSLGHRSSTGPGVGRSLGKVPADRELIQAGVPSVCKLHARRGSKYFKC